MTSPKPLADVERAKNKLKHDFASQPWCKGIGITPADDGLFALRLNVDADHRPDDSALPREYDGIPIEIVYTSGYRSR